jgi:CRP-like cAMP-binding protein
MPGIPGLDRLFSSGSLLGLPSTFNAKPYSLTATCLTDCKVAQVDAKRFLDLMQEHPDLCREATEMLSSELAFILSALRKRARKAASRSPQQRRPTRRHAYR